MQSDTVSLVTLVPADNHHKLNTLIKNVSRASPQNGRCLQMGSAQYYFWELRNLVCIQLTNYSANYTLGKLNPGAKDFITSIATNIVLGYKLPGSLDPVTFYFDISNRFIICSGKKSSFLKLLFQVLEYHMNVQSFWEVKYSKYSVKLASALLHTWRALQKIIDGGTHRINPVYSDNVIFLSVWCFWTMRTKPIFN